MNRGLGACQIESKTAGRSQAIAARPKSAGNDPDLSSRSKRESRKILAAGLSGHQILLIGDMGRRGSLCNKCQFISSLNHPAV